MDQNFIKTFQLIGKVQSVIGKSETLDGALKGGMKVILENSSADYGIIWYLNKNDKRLHPYYWICPTDLTRQSFAPGEGLSGKAYEKNDTIVTHYDNGSAEQELFYRELNVQTVVSVPFGGEEKSFGCIELMRRADQDDFTEDDIELCRMLVLMADLAIREKSEFEDSIYPENVILTARDVKREFENGEFITPVLKGVNLDVVEGELIVILGESGCGKSTFLNIIGGMDQATDGTFSFLGKDMSNVSQAELTKYRRDHIGFIFQSYNLMPNLTAKQNLDLIGELVDDPMDSEEALALVGLKNRADNYPSQLSGGQQQRVSIARALVKRPKLIFADEPTAALDYATSIEVLSVLEKIVKKGTTLLMVTHNEEIVRMANRVIRMRDGKTFEVTVNHFPVHATELVW